MLSISQRRRIVKLIPKKDADLKVEVMAEAIRKRKEIVGITVKGKKEIKLSQYADDTTLILDGSEQSVNIRKL